MRNKVKLDIKKLIQSEQQNIAINIKKNPKKFWKYINCKTKGSNKIGNIKYFNKNGTEKIADTDHDKCNAFIDYFNSVFTKENEFNENNITFKPCNSIMSDFIIERNDLYKKLKNLKIDKSSGLEFSKKIMRNYRMFYANYIIYL